VERAGSTLYVTPSARLFERLDSGASDDALLVAGLIEVGGSQAELQ
jgi:hypothetical protein